MQKMLHSRLLSIVFCLTDLVLSARVRSSSLLAKGNRTHESIGDVESRRGPTVMPSPLPSTLPSTTPLGFLTPVTPLPSQQLLFSGPSAVPASPPPVSSAQGPTLEPGVNMYGVDENQCQIQRQYTSKPALCPQKNDRFSRKELQQSVVEFSKVYAEMRKTFPRSQCCMGVNHRFAIYHSVKSLKPLVIIESGIAAGHTTWLLRQTAGPNVPIFSLDPTDPLYSYPVSSGIGGWKDKSGMTRYLTGKDFQDLAFARWDVLIPDPHVRNQTLVILDDHQSSVERLKMLKRWGFRYAFYEDNYPYKVATSEDMSTCLQTKGLKRGITQMFGDAYSPNTVCSALPAGTHAVLHKDHFGHRCKWLSLSEHGMNVQWMQRNLEGYFEFPPIFTPCQGVVRESLMAGLTNVQPQLQEMLLRQYGFPSVQLELWHYGHLFPALLELKPVPEFDREKQVKEAVWQTAAFAKDAKAHGEWVR